MENPHMSIANAQNLRRDPGADRHYGIRVTTRAGDPFRLLVGADWAREHWFETQEERDQALAEMSRLHEYSRPNDRPTLEFSPVTR
jgi:hypothetical protein